MGDPTTSTWHGGKSTSSGCASTSLLQRTAYDAKTHQAHAVRLRAHGLQLLAHVGQKRGSV
jgi:hypothetical protein